MAKVDDSLFEDVPYQAEADDSLFEDAPHPEAQQEEVRADDPVGEATRQTMGSAVGMGIGSAVDHGLRHGGHAVMGHVGNLDGKDIDTISANRDVYNTIPQKNPLEEMMEQFRTLGEKNRSGGIQAAADARKSLEGAAPLKVEELYKTLAKPAENPKYSTQLSPEKATELLGDELDRAYPTIEDKQFAMSKADADLADIDNQLNSPFVNERAEINQAAKEAKFENRLGQIEPKLTSSAVNTDIVDKAGDEFKVKKETRQLQRMDEKIAKLEAKAIEKPKAAETLENIQKRKEDFLYNQVNSKKKAETTRDVRNTKQFDAAENRKSQLELNKIIEDEKAAQLRLLEEVKKKESLLEQKRALEEKKAKIGQKIERTINKAAEKADANLQNIKQAPPEIRKVSPFLEDRILGEDYAKSLEDSISDVRNSDSIDPVRLDQKLQEIRDNVPEGKMNTVGKFNSELSTALKDDLQSRYPGYKEGMGKASESFKTEALFDKLGISYNKDLDRITLENSGRSRINQILLNPDKYPEEYGFLQEALQDSEKNGYLQSTVDDTLKRGEMSALKNDVNRLRKGQDLNAFDINSIAKGEYSRTPGIASKLGGTRLQELYGMYKDSKAGKFAQGASKYGLPLVGGLIGAAASAEAASNDELSVPAAIAAGAGEVVNPTPFDLVEGAKAGSQAIDDTIANTSMDELTAEPDASGDIIAPGQDLALQNPVLKNATEAFAKGAVQHIPELANAATERLEGFGMNASNNARSRMEQNMKASEPKLNEEFKSFVESRPEQVEELAQFFAADNSTQAFVAPLEKAAQGDDRTRSAVLFGLYQQPAFRQALKNKMGQGM